MKTFLSMLSTAAIIVCISCNPKTQEPSKNTYSEAQKEYLKKLQQPLLAGPTPKEMEAYLQEVKPLREEFDKTLDAMSPGLSKKYLDEAKELSDIKDTSKRQDMISKMEKKYKEPFMKAWQKSSIADKIENINEKYFKKYKCIKGDFGSTIVIINPLDSVFLDTASGGPTLASDSTIDAVCPLEVVEHQSGCSLIAWGDAFSSSDCSINVSNESHFGGGCDVEGRIGKSFSIPAQYTDITADFTANYFINAIAVAIIGGGWASAEVGIKINENGVDKISSAVASITAVAPVIWVYSQSANAANQHFITSYHRSSSTGDLNVIPKLYSKETSGAAVNAQASSDGSISNVTALRIRLHQE
jgi:hypothetical protein